MAAPYVTGAEILQEVAGSGAPSTDPQDVALAASCAAAVEGAIAHRLGDGAFTPTSSQDAMLQRTAVVDGAAMYIARKAPHGVLSVGPDGDVVRLGSAILRASEQVLYPINPGIG